MRCPRPGRRLLRSVLLGLAFLAPAAPLEAAVVYREARVRRIFEGREVYIDQRQAKVADLARSGNTLRSRRSRAELLFDRRAIGLLGRQTLIRLGSRCFRLDAGAILVNGTQRSCLGSKVLGVRGTTYALEREGEEGTYVLSVLAGEARLEEAAGDGPDAGASATATEGEVDILGRYPRLNPVLSLGASAFDSEGRPSGDRFSSGDDDLSVGTSASLVRAEGDLFLPLVQHEARAHLYTSVGGNANFDGYGAVRAELGYRWFNPDNRAITGLYLAYGGFENPVCFGSSVNGGVQWERNRWRLGAAVGVNADGCDNGLSFASLSLGIPVAQLEEETAHLSLTPYGISGAGDSWGGGRLALDVPVGPALGFNLYGSWDPLFRTTVGGGFRWRIPLGGGFVRDPNPSEPPPPEDPAALAGTGTVVVREGEQASFDADGNLIGEVRSLGPDAFAALVKKHQGGANPLPEGRRIVAVARRLGVDGGELRELLDITGAHFVDQARPVGETVDTPFWPDGIQPTLPTDNGPGRDRRTDDDNGRDTSGGETGGGDTSGGDTSGGDTSGGSTGGGDTGGGDTGGGDTEPPFEAELPTDILIPGPPL